MFIAITREPDHKVTAITYHYKMAEIAIVEIGRSLYHRKIGVKFDPWPMQYHLKTNSISSVWYVFLLALFQCGEISQNLPSSFDIMF